MTPITVAALIGTAVNGCCLLGVLGFIGAVALAGRSERRRREFAAEEES